MIRIEIIVHDEKYTKFIDKIIDNTEGNGKVFKYNFIKSGNKRVLKNLARVI